MGSAKYSGLDFASKRSRFGISTADLTAGNIAAELALSDALLAALVNFSYIPFGNVENARDVASVGKATDEDGMRSFKARVIYSGDTLGKLYDVEIPAPIRAGNLIAGTTFFDLADAQVSAFVAAFEAYAKAPDDITETVTVVSIQSVGRTV